MPVERSWAYHLRKPEGEIFELEDDGWRRKAQEGWADSPYKLNWDPPLSADQATVAQSVRNGFTPAFDFVGAGREEQEAMRDENPTPTEDEVAKAKIMAKRDRIKESIEKAATAEEEEADRMSDEQKKRGTLNNLKGAVRQGEVARMTEQVKETEAETRLRMIYEHGGTVNLTAGQVDNILAGMTEIDPLNITAEQYPTICDALTAAGQNAG